MPLSDRTAEAADDADAETEGGGVATEIAVAEEVLEELEGALAEGELTVDEAEAAEEVVVETTEAALAAEAEEARDDA